MPTENDRPDDSEPPPEIDKGLERAFGGKKSPRPESPSVLDRIGELTGDKPKVSLRDTGESGHTPILKPLGRDIGRLSS